MLKGKRKKIVVDEEVNPVEETNVLKDFQAAQEAAWSTDEWEAELLNATPFDEVPLTMDQADRLRIVYLLDPLGLGADSTEPPVGRLAALQVYLSLWQTDTWLDGNGVMWPLTEMTDSHLANVKAFFDIPGMSSNLSWLDSALLAIVRTGMESFKGEAKCPVMAIHSFIEETPLYKAIVAELESRKVDESPIHDFSFSTIGLTEDQAEELAAWLNKKTPKKLASIVGNAGD